MQQMATCPNCGAQNSAIQQYCVSCGSHLGGPQRQVSHVPIVTGVAPVPPAAPIPPPSPAAPRDVEIKPTWGLAWGLFWRTLLLWLFLLGAVFLCYLVVRLALGYNGIW